MMARQMGKGWENADGKLHEEEQISAADAKQGRTGARILTILIVALILAFVVWIPVEIWGKRQATDVAPQQPGQQLQSQQSTPPAPSAQAGNAVPTETPNTQPAKPPATQPAQ
jgi:hypothetical protein